MFRDLYYICILFAHTCNLVKSYPTRLRFDTFGNRINMYLMKTYSVPREKGERGHTNAYWKQGATCPCHWGIEYSFVSRGHWIFSCIQCLKKLYARYGFEAITISRFDILFWCTIKTYLWMYLRLTYMCGVFFFEWQRKKLCGYPYNQMWYTMYGIINFLPWPYQMLKTWNFVLLWIYDYHCFFSYMQ